MNIQILRTNILNTRIIDCLFILLLIVNLALPNFTAVRGAVILLFEISVLFFEIGKKRNTVLHVCWGVLFFTWAFLSVKWALYPQGVYDQIRNVFWAISINVLITRYIVVFDVKIETICKVMIACSIILIINSIINGTTDLMDSRLSVDINENTYGKILSGMSFFVLYYAYIQKKKKYYLILLPIYILIFLSGSRKAILACAFFIIYLLLSDQNHILKNILIFTGVIVSFYILMIKVDYFYNIIGYRLVGLFNYILNGRTEDGSVITRVNMMKMAWNIFMDSPIYGIGLNNFKYYAYYNTYSHNNYVELLCCTGIIGLLLYYIPLFLIFIQALRQRDSCPSEVILSIGLMVVFFILDVGNVSYFVLSDHIFLGISIGYYYKTKVNGVSAWNPLGVNSYYSRKTI